MSFGSSIRGRLILSAAVLAGSATTLAAQGRPLLAWSGRVDREVRITMHARDAWAQGIGDKDRGRRVYIDNPLPDADGEVRVRVEQGRGDVDVVQQPSRRNDYTTIIRIQDRSGGTDFYSIRAFWNPIGGFADRDRDRDRDRDQDRDRDRDRDYDRNRDRDRGGWDMPGRGRPALHWSGEVDGDVEIQLRGDHTEYHTTGGHRVRNVRADVMAGLPRDEVAVRVNRREGRGTIEVIQQPSASNRYTAVIAVHDRQSGYGFYDFDVVWR